MTYRMAASLNREEEIPITSGGVRQLIDELSRRSNSSVDAVLLPYTLSIANKSEAEEILSHTQRVLVEHGLLVAINPDLAAIASEVGRGAGMNDTLFEGSALSHAIHMSRFQRSDASLEMTPDPGLTSSEQLIPARGLSLHTFLYGQEALPHRNGFTPQTINEALERAGYGDVQALSENIELWSAATKIKRARAGDQGVNGVNGAGDQVRVGEKHDEL